VINNSGVAEPATSLDQYEDWHRVFSVNLDGARRVSIAAVRRLVALGRPGAIVNVASILGLRQGAGVTAYAASKAALVQMTRQHALEWARHGIRVNALAPGYIETDLNRDFFSTEAGQAQVRRITQRRLGRPEELDGSLLLLASEAGSFITGSVLVTSPGGPERFERRPIPTPSAGPGEAVVRHTAIGLNFIDVYHRTGLYPWKVERDLVPGSEAAGTVESVGPGVETVAVGDRVAYTRPLGAYASSRAIAADRLVRLPPGIDDAAAATLILKGLTAQYLIHSSFRVEPGMHVLVHAAAGGVGLLLGQWLAAKGVTAIGTAGGPEKVALAAAHGYAHVIDYKADDFSARVREITGGQGVDVVYDSVGRDTWRGSFACLRQHGSFVCFGQSSGSIEGFGISDLAKGSFHACRPTLFHYIATAEALQSRAADLFAAIDAGTIRPEVRQRQPLEAVADVHRDLEARRTTGATVLIP
jgi:NADPH:quinone reductase